MDKSKNKPNCKLIGQDSNMFSMLVIASRTLKENGMYKEAEEMFNRAKVSNYDEALSIIGEYVTIC